MTAAAVDVLHDAAPEVYEDRTPVLEHRENCLCSKAAKTKPAVMFDERPIARGGIEVEILEALDHRLTEEGAPMYRTYTRRWNEAGEGIGPEMKIRSCDAWLFCRVLDRVLGVLERGAERQR
jgi:hypothetical protein